MKIPSGNRLDMTIDVIWAYTRLLCRSKFDGDCIVTTGYKDHHGYGQVKVCGKSHWQHRVAYAARVGTVPHGMDVHHKCRNKSCIRPLHLALVKHDVHGQVSRMHR